MDNEKKIKHTAFRLAFLMQHQTVTPELELETQGLFAVGNTHQSIDGVNKESIEYLAGAADAFAYLIKFLKQKGPQI